MKNKKSNKGFAVVVIILISLVILLTGYIVYDKVLGNKKDDNNSVETKNNEKNTGKEKENTVSLTKDEKDKLIQNEVDSLIKLLNTDYTEHPSNSCDYFGIDLNLVNQKEDMLSVIAPYLMSCKFGMNYIEDDDLSPISTTNLMDEDMYKKFKNYFSSSLNKKEIIGGKTYYVAYVDGDGFAVRPYDFQLNEKGITENNGVYSVIIDLFENNMLGCLVARAELKLSIRDNHVYYESFEIRDDLLDS